MTRACADQPPSRREELQEARHNFPREAGYQLHSCIPLLTRRNRAMDPPGRRRLERERHRRPGARPLRAMGARSGKRLELPRTNRSVVCVQIRNYGGHMEPANGKWDSVAEQRRVCRGSSWERVLEAR